MYQKHFITRFFIKEKSEIFSTMNIFFEHTFCEEMS